MSVSKHQILASLATVEARSPLFESDMPVPGEVAREIFASAMSQLTATPAFRRASTRSREVSLLASLAYALLDAAYLRHQLNAQTLAATEEADRLIARVAAP